MDRRLITVSKFLAKHLRHAPEDLGLVLQPGGWVRVDDVLSASERVEASAVLTPAIVGGPRRWGQVRLGRRLGDVSGLRSGSAPS